MKLLKLSILGLLLFSIKGNAQDKYEYLPVQFGQFMHHLSLVNPANNGFRDELEFNLCNQIQAGDWDISRYYATFNSSIKNKSLKNKNVIGLTFFSDNEGSFLRRTSLYANYSWHTEINNKMNFGGGISGGFFNYFVNSSSSLGSASAYSPDANAGILLYHDNYKIGTSVNHVFDSELQPYTEISVLRRHFNIFASGTLNPLTYFSISPHFLWNSLATDGFKLDIGITMNLFDIISAGYSIRYRAGAALILGIYNYQWNNGIVDFLFSYNYPVRNSDITVDRYEITIGYYLDKKRRK